MPRRCRGGRPVGDRPGARRGTFPGAGVGTIASARADNDDTAPVNEVVGRSVQGRPIVATRYGDATSDRIVLVVGVIHGDERAGLRIVRALRRRARQPWRARNSG